MKRIVALGSEFDGTGFARVLEAARALWKGRVELDVHSGRILADQIRRVGARSASQTPAALSLRSALASASPSRLLIIGDPKLAGYAMMAAKEELMVRPAVVWTTIDSPSLDSRIIESLLCTESVFLPTRKQTEVLRGLVSRWEDRHHPRVEHAPFPVAVDRFCEIPGARSLRSEREAIRGALFANVGPDDFLVLNSNFNLSRKRIDLTVAAVAQLSPSPGPRVVLCLNMRPNGNSAWDIGRLCAASGLADRIAVARIPRVLTDDEMNLLYNAADVGLNTSTGEGYGLVNLEHAATSAAQLLPAHETNSEIWEGYPGLIRASRWLATHTPGHSESLVDTHRLAARLAMYRDNPEQLHTDGVLAQRCAQSAARDGELGSLLVLQALLAPSGA